MNTVLSKNKGFTLVELLIVIVVIAILASIVLVSYVGVQNQTKAENARTNAASVKKAAETYYGENNAYPTLVADFSTTYAKLQAGITILTTGSLTSTNGANSIMYRYINSGGSASGACILFWNFQPESGPPGVETHAVIGNATDSTCNASVGTLPS